MKETNEPVDQALLKQVEAYNIEHGIDNLSSASDDDEEVPEVPTNKKQKLLKVAAAKPVKQ